MSTSRSPIESHFKRIILIGISSRFTEAKAIKKNQETRRRSDRVRELLEMLGDDRKIRPLATRCAGVFTPPLSPSPHAEALRAELQSAMTAWEEVLAKDFRTGPAR